MAVVDRAPTLYGAPFASGGVRYRRLVVDRPECGLVVDLHPAITVALVRSEEAPAAARLAAGALEGDEPGVHLEFTDADGRELVAFRPHGGRARFVDVVEQVEVTAEVRPGRGTVSAELGRLASVEPADLVDVVDRLFAAVEAESFRESARRDRGRRSRRAKARADRQAAEASAAEASAVEAAYAAWDELMPGLGVGWAIEHAAAVSACAEAARRSSALIAVDDGELRAQAVVATVAALLAEPHDRPQVVALPAPGLGPAESELLFDLLSEVLRGRQVLVVTDSPRVAAWARLESLAGRAAVVEPDLVIGAL